MIQVYTGEGKGKTTAAVGLAVRAAPHLKVLFVQFLKDGTGAEVVGLEKLSGITYRAFGTGDFVKDSSPVQESKVKEGLLYVQTKASDYQLIILDELISAISLGVIPETEALSLIESIDAGTEIVLTGHNASHKLVELADLVTEMKPIKHYYNKGIKARIGIEY